MARQRLRPLRNTALQQAITRSGWTLAATAEAVNMVGAENGIRLTYSAASIAHWLAGAIPRPETIPVAMEAFARGLDRNASAADLGWGDRPVTVAADDPWDGDAVAWLARLARCDMDRRGALATGLYSVAALTIPTVTPGVPRRPGRDRRAGAGDVERIRATTRQFSDLDDRFGGGHARTAVAAYMSADVVPLLHGTTGRCRPDLFHAAAELAYLAGYMAADGGDPGLGQRYYVQAVKLADEANDPLMRATVLRSLAVQAIELGHPAKALDLAESAMSEIRGGCPVRTRAWVTGAYAEALAGMSSGWAARQMLRRAERDLERADSVPESVVSGNYRRESLEHQTGTLLAVMGDLAGAEEHLAVSVGSRRSVERRSRALIGARLAGVQFLRGDRDGVKATLLDVREDLVGVESARVRRALATLPRELRVAVV